jgi:diguanylate cyclase (GGDEF)-like protein
MLQSEIFISLPSVDVASQKGFWNRMRSQVDSELESKEGAKKQVVLQSVSLLTALAQGFAKAGVNDIVSLIVDDEVVFLDTMGRDDDLRFALEAVMNLPPEKSSFNQVFLVLEHVLDDMHIVIEATVHAKYREGSYPMRIRSMGRIMTLRPNPGELAPNYAGRVREFVRNPDAIQLYREKLTAFSMGIVRSMEEALPGCPMRITKTLVQVTRLEPEQIQALGGLALGGQIPGQQYRPAPEEGSTGGLDDRYEYFYYDPYHLLVNWCLLDAMLTERSWSAKHFRVVHPTGSILHRGEDLPAAIQGYGVNAYSVTTSLGLGRPGGAMAQAPDHQHTEVRQSQSSGGGLDATDRIHGRSALFKQLEYEVKRAKRYGRTVGLSVVAVDDLSNYAARYGATAGDQLNDWIATRLEGICRDADILGDLGGGLFGIVMPEAELEGARLASARLRREIKDYSGGSRPAQHVSVSIGSAVLLKPKSNSARALLAIGEQCLRKAQEGGPNSSLVIEARL